VRLKERDFDCVLLTRHIPNKGAGSASELGEAVSTGWMGMTDSWLHVLVLPIKEVVDLYQSLPITKL
jgi:hypothetical protein